MPENFDRRFDDLKDRVDGHDHRLARQDTIIAQLQADMSKLTAAIANVATKDDVLVVLRDAVNAFPGRYTLILVGISVAIAVAGWLLRAH